MAILKLKVKRIRTYGDEAPIYGDLISKNDYRPISHWKGNDSIRQTDNGKIYLYIREELMDDRNGLRFGETIYEVLEEKAPNIEGMNFYDFASDCSLHFGYPGGEGIIYFANEINELSNV